MRNKAPPTDNLPSAPTVYDPKWGRSLVQAISDALSRRLAVTQPTPELLMLSPDGSVYALKVSDNGTLSTELRSRP